LGQPRLTKPTLVDRALGSEALVGSSTATERLFDVMQSLDFTILKLNLFRGGAMSPRPPPFGACGRRTKSGTLLP